MRERIVRAVAGVFTLLSVTLAVFVNIHWIWFTVFVGANLLQSSFSGFCPLELLLNKLGVKKGDGSCC